MEEADNRPSSQRIVDRTAKVLFVFVLIALVVCVTISSIQGFDSTWSFYSFFVLLLVLLVIVFIAKCAMRHRHRISEAEVDVQASVLYHHDGTRATPPLIQASDIVGVHPPEEERRSLKEMRQCSSNYELARTRKGSEFSPGSQDKTKKRRCSS